MVRGVCTLLNASATHPPTRQVVEVLLFLIKKKSSFTVTILGDNSVFSILKSVSCHLLKGPSLSPPGIVNRDGTRYTQKGEYRTNPDDINNTTADYDTSSGSYGERSTPESYIIYTHFPTAHPTQDSPGVTYYPEDTPDTSKDSESLGFPRVIHLQNHLGPS